MTRTQIPAPPSASPLGRTTARRTRRLLLVVLVIAMAAITAFLVKEVPKSSHFSAASPSNSLRGEDRGALGAAEGAVPDGTTVFDDTAPAVTKLEPALLKALRQAATDAADDGVEVYVNSGWRSPAYQRRLLREAIAEYGSEDEAARYVATPETSPHVSGDAVDVGRTDATAWLSGHGSAYGLCQIYRNEPWHYELRADATEHGCPQMYADPTQDPRMQK